MTSRQRDIIMSWYQGSPPKFREDPMTKLDRECEKEGPHDPQTVDDCCRRCYRPHLPDRHWNCRGPRRRFRGRRFSRRRLSRWRFSRWRFWPPRFFRWVRWFRSGLLRIRNLLPDRLRYHLLLLIAGHLQSQDP